MNYQNAIYYINNLDRSSARVFSGEAGLRRSIKFFNLLGNPQEKIQTVHIAGTSGKGSTAMMLSSLLVSANQKVGLTLSPHVYDIRERCQVNNLQISKRAFANTLEQIIPIIDEMAKSGDPVSYFETLLAMAWMHFIEQKVDYAVIETGMGGRLDATNTIKNPKKVAIITRIGRDHTNVLGNQIQSIAEQKAGIIQTGNYCFCLSQAPSVNRVFEQRAKAVHASIRFAKAESINDKSEFISSLPEFQQENLSLALVTARHLATGSSWNLDHINLMTTLKNMHIPGRFEVIEKAKTIFILDGAHNSQKITALIKATQKLYPKKEIGLILAMKNTKDVPIIPERFQIIATQYEAVNNQDFASDAYNSEQLTQELIRNNSAIAVKKRDRLEPAIVEALNSPNKVWLITGSFLLLAEARQILSEV